MYWLTGSQQFHLMNEVCESLAGRVGIINMNSFTYSEIIENKDKQIFDPTDLKVVDKINVNEIFEIIFKGGMPRLYTEKNISLNAYFSGYVDTYIARDVRANAQVVNE